MNKLINIVSKLLNIFPEKFRHGLFTIVLNFFPISLIKKIPCSYSAYLKCYYPQQGDVIMDCGAHIGNCAILFSRLVGREGFVIAVEPFEESFNILEKRIHRLKKKNIISINKGVWNKTANLPLSVFENTIACKISEDINTDPARDHNINCVTIDQIADELRLNRLHLIKMDIEGAEIEALEGARNTINRFNSNFAIASYHRRSGHQTYKIVENMLSGNGYKVDTFFPPHLTTCGVRRDSIYA